ncbi:hypothetical protein D9M72_287360 [compost metagenome]
MFTLEKQTVILAHLNVRPENHGDEKVGGADLKIAFTESNGLLGKLDVIKLNYARMRLNAMQTQGA